eukprot:gene5666-35614_t
MALVSMLLQFALNESKADGVFIRTLVPAAASAAVWLLLQGERKQVQNLKQKQQEEEEERRQKQEEEQRNNTNHYDIPELVYLDNKGTAEPIRLALVMGNVKFTDTRVSYEQATQLRADGRLGINVGMVHTQTAALLRWAGRQSTLYPDDHEEQLVVDAAEELMVDIKTALVPQWYKHALPRNPKTGKLIDEVKLDSLQAAALDKMVQQSGGPFLCGNVMRTCDLMLYGMVSGLLDGSYCSGIQRSVLDECTAVAGLVHRVANHPKVLDWNARGGKGGVWIPMKEVQL